MAIVPPTGRPDDTFAARLAQLPAAYRPDQRLTRYRTLKELVRAFKAPPFGLPAPEAVELAGEYGLPACEGALFKVLADMAGRRREIKEPRALLVWTLRRGKSWTPDQVAAYLGALLDDALAAMAASDDVTAQRLARELQRQWGEGPENVTDFPAARAR